MPQRSEHAPQTTHAAETSGRPHHTTMHCALRRAMHAGRRALSTTPAPQSQSRSWVLGVASAAAGAAGALAVAGERPPPSVAEWAARDDPGSSNAEQRFAQWKRVDEQLVASGAAKSNAIYDAFGAVWKSTSELGSRRWRGAPEI